MKIVEITIRIDVVGFGYFMFGYLSIPLKEWADKLGFKYHVGLKELETLNTLEESIK